MIVLGSCDKKKCTFKYVGLLKMRYGKEGVDNNLNTLTM